jgi:hypothetical protein
MSAVAFKYPRAYEQVPLYLLPNNDRGGSHSHRRPTNTSEGSPSDFPYLVEVWDLDNLKIELVAATAHGGIGYAAYYQAAKEHPTKYVTLRFGTRILARWNPPAETSDKAPVEE